MCVGLLDVSNGHPDRIRLILYLPGAYINLLGSPFLLVKVRSALLNKSAQIFNAQNVRHSNLLKEQCSYMQTGSNLSLPLSLYFVPSMLQTFSHMSPTHSLAQDLKESPLVASLQQQMLLDKRHFTLSILILRLTMNVSSH